MATTTAEVVTLEAAVRVLQVGNRQITQSVANQLDIVDPWQMTAMGRVKIKDELFAIGRDNRTGDLVRARDHWRGCPHTPDTGSADDEYAWTSLKPIAVTARYTTSAADPNKWTIAEWRLNEQVEPWSDEPCDCCEGCDFVATGSWGVGYRPTTSGYTTGRLDDLPRPPHTGPTFEGDRATVEGLAYLRPVQKHTGTGNRYTRQWLESLPLIVLAGLR